MSKFKKLIIRKLPSSLAIKAWIIAWKDKFVPVRETYSQAGEDIIVERLLSQRSSHGMIYIDVGANHPTRLSNTYKFYRKGWRGLVIEPNRTLLNMHRRIRPDDQHLAIGCGERPELLEFRHAESHVLSSFSREKMKTNEVNGTELIPVLRLDDCIGCLNKAEVGILSVDVEGLDLEVVKGGTELLKKTWIVIIEGEEEDTAIVDFFDSQDFELTHSTKHNLIFVSRKVITAQECVFDSPITRSNQSA